MPQTTRKLSLNTALIGDIGEVICEKIYDIKLDDKQRKDFDAKLNYGNQDDVQIKISLKSKFTYHSTEGYFIALYLNEDNEVEEVFNGLNQHIYEQLKDRRKNLSTKKTILSAKILRECSQSYTGPKVQLRSKEI